MASSFESSFKLPQVPSSPRSTQDSSTRTVDSWQSLTAAAADGPRVREQAQADVNVESLQAHEQEQQEEQEPVDIRKWLSLTASQLSLSTTSSSGSGAWSAAPPAAAEHEQNACTSLTASSRRHRHRCQQAATTARDENDDAADDDEERAAADHAPSSASLPPLPPLPPRAAASGGSKSSPPGTTTTTPPASAIHRSFPPAHDYTPNGSNNDDQEQEEQDALDSVMREYLAAFSSTDDFEHDKHDDNDHVESAGEHEKDRLESAKDERAARGRATSDGSTTTTTSSSISDGTSDGGGGREKKPLHEAESKSSGDEQLKGENDKSTSETLDSGKKTLPLARREMLVGLLRALGRSTAAVVAPRQAHASFLIALIGGFALAHVGTIARLALASSPARLLGAPALLLSPLASQGPSSPPATRTLSSSVNMLGGQAWSVPELLALSSSPSNDSSSSLAHGDSHDEAARASHYGTAGDRNDDATTTVWTWTFALGCTLACALLVVAWALVVGAMLGPRSTHPRSSPAAATSPFSSSLRSSSDGDDDDDDDDGQEGEKSQQKRAVPTNASAQTLARLARLHERLDGRLAHVAELLSAGASRATMPSSRPADLEGRERSGDMSIAVDERARMAHRAGTLKLSHARAVRPFDRAHSVRLARDACASLERALRLRRDCADSWAALAHALLLLARDQEAVRPLALAERLLAKRAGCKSDEADEKQGGERDAASSSKTRRSALCAQMALASSRAGHAWSSVSAHLARALELDPLNASARAMLADEMHARGQGGSAREAQRLVERALEVDDHDAPAHMRAALIAIELCERAKAVKHLERAIELRAGRFDAHEDPCEVGATRAAVALRGWTPHLHLCFTIAGELFAPVRMGVIERGERVAGLTPSTLTSTLLAISSGRAIERANDLTAQLEAYERTSGTPKSGYAFIADLSTTKELAGCRALCFAALQGERYDGPHVGLVLAQLDALVKEAWRQVGLGDVPDGLSDETTDAFVVRAFDELIQRRSASHTVKAESLASSECTVTPPRRRSPRTKKTATTTT